MEFIKGMDVSSYQEMKDKGYKYFDVAGNEIDILEYAVQMGFNYGRIRIWNEPSNRKESGGYCNFRETLKLAKRMKEIGIPYLLDFHYSDWWADPGQQNKPKKWERLHGKELEKAVHDYTQIVVEALTLAELAPDMVQIGNEIRCGMLWPDGSVENFHELANLINAGISGVRDCPNGKDIKIMIHLDQGGRYHYFEDWFDKIIENGVTDFDIIGLSYYPFWHGTYKDLDETMNKLAHRYKRDLIVAEVAYGYRMGADSLFGKGQERLGGFSASQEGQKKALQIVAGIISGVEDNRGKGFFYWEPFSRAEEPDNWGYCMGIVDEEGKPLEALKAVDKEIVIPVEQAREMYNAIDYADDSQVEIEGENILTDAQFDRLMTGWNYDKPENVTASIVEDEGIPTFKFSSVGNVKFDLSHNITIEKSGKYSMVVEYKGDNTTGVCIKPFTKLNGYIRETNIYPSDTRWTRGTIDLELDAGTDIVVGIEIDSPQITGEIRNFGVYLKE